MMLTILFGAVAARLVLPHLSIWEAGILAAVLAPTDAGFGQIIVNSPRVPMLIRQTLNVEAGLNDGLSVPFLLFVNALAAARIEGPAASLTQFIVEQLGYGVLVGGGIGLIGGWLLDLARRREWMAESFLQIGVVALPLLCLVVSKMVNGSAFIAAFVAGLTTQIGFKEAGKHSVEFAEEWGQLLNRSEEHTSELQSHSDLVCRLLLEKKKKYSYRITYRFIGDTTTWLNMSSDNTSSFDSSRMTCATLCRHTHSQVLISYWTYFWLTSH